MTLLDAILRDARYAWRGLWKAPTFTLIVIVTLTLGIGATTAIFTVVNALLIAPLPYRDSSALVLVWADMTSAGYQRAPLSGPELSDLRQGTSTFSDLGAIWATSAVLSGQNETEQVRIGAVTTSFFSMLGVDAAIGRTFRPEDEPQLAAEHLLLSWAFWQRKYGGDRSVVGRAIRLGNLTATVIGVLPADFKLLFPSDASVPDDLDAFVPFNRTLPRLPRAQSFLKTVGRLKPGVTIAQAQADVNGVARRISREYAEYGPDGRVFSLVDMQRDGVRHLRAALLTIFGGVEVLLIIACLNVASLLMARAASRTKETAVRLALGAGRVELFRQSLIEGLLLAVLGGAAGLLAGRWALSGLIALRPDSLSRLASARLDPGVLIFTIGTSLIWGLFFSFAPVAMALRTNVASTLQQEGRRMGGVVHYRARAALVVAQMALGITLLVGAGLLVRTFLAIQRVDPGFRSDSLVTFRLGMAGPRYRTIEAVNTTARALQTRLSTLPGVTSVGAVTHLPFDHVGDWAGPYAVKVGVQDKLAPLADYRAITPGYLETVGTQLAEGRFFTEADDPASEPVALVDDILARRLWPGRSAVGQRLAVDSGSNGNTDKMVTVVGVVRHSRQYSLMEDGREQVYLPWRQFRWSPIAFVVRASGDPVALAPAIRRVVAEIEPLLPVYDLRPLDDYVTKAKATQRFSMILAAAFAVVALVLACVGVYGIVAYAVTQRRYEFGVRLALGAQPGQIVGLVLRDGMMLTAVGIVLGVAGGLAGAQLLQSQLFGVSPRDIVSYAIAASALGACAIAACWISAWRAMVYSPVDSLRTG
jgi:predicted permease